MVAKQVIAVNLAANMGIGRLCAQACHASILSLLNRGQWNAEGLQINTKEDSALHYWMKESFTKVVVKVWGEEELLSLQDKAERLGISTALMIEDDGQKTALALGPCEPQLLDKVTKELTLL